MSLWGDVNFHQNRDNMNLVVQSCHATGHQRPLLTYDYIFNVKTSEQEYYQIEK
jgi:hypothetical protein